MANVKTAVCGINSEAISAVIDRASDLICCEIFKMELDEETNFDETCGSLLKGVRDFCKIVYFQCNIL